MKRGGEFADLFCLSADVRQTRAQILDQMPAFGTAHIVQFDEGFEQASVHRVSEAFLFVLRFRYGGGETSNDAGQAQDSDDIDVRCRSGQLAELFGDPHVSLSEFSIYLNWSSCGWVHIYVHLDVPAVNALSQDLPQAQFIQVKAFGKAELQIQEAVVDAFDADTDRPAVLFVPCLSVTGHR